MLRNVLNPKQAKFSIRKLRLIGSSGESKILAGHCRVGMLSSATEIRELLYASYLHQNGRHRLKMEACSTMSYNSSAKKKFHQTIKRLTYKYSRMLIDTYPGILGSIDCREECR